MNSDCTILVCSCDKYADVVGPFAKCVVSMSREE